MRIWPRMPTATEAAAKFLLEAELKLLDAEAAFERAQGELSIARRRVSRLVQRAGAA